MSVMVNKDILQGKWKQMRGKVKQQWGKLTGDQLDRINGTDDELTGLVQENYGYTFEKARQELDGFLQRQDPKTG
jgi:uncharacterized protein YjbJ (UPF0337 family)